MNWLRIGCLLILGICCAACSSESVEDRLGTCPPDDMLWHETITTAKEQGTLPELHALTVELMETCPQRWEPAWAAGECLLQENPRAPIEVIEQMRGHWELALARAEALEDPVGRSRALNRLGVYYKKVQDLDTAERTILAAFDAAEQAGRDDLRAFALNNLAGAYRTQVRLAEAIEALERATVFIKRAGKPDLARRFAYNRAVLLEDVGQFAEQRRVLVQIYAESLAAGETDRVHQVSQVMGSNHLRMGELEAAREWFLKVPEDSSQATRAAYGLGRIALLEQRYDDAVPLLDRVSNDQRSRVLALFGRTSRGEVDLRAGRLTQAQERLTAVVQDADEIGLLDIASQARCLLGKVALAHPGGVDEAITYFTEAMQIVDGSGAGLDPSRGGMTYLRERSEPFAELAAGLAVRDEQAGAAEILRVMGKAHARALREILGGQGRMAVITSLEDLQSQLAANELLVDYLIGEDRGTLLAIGRTGVDVVTLPGWRDLRSPLRRYIAALQRPLRNADARLDPMQDLARDLERGRDLRRILLDPLPGLFKSIDRLYVVPDRDLALLPFAALPLDGPGDVRFVGDEIELAVMPMAGVIQEWTNLTPPLLMAGDPVPDPAGRFGELPLAAAEIAGVREIWGAAPTTELTGEALTLDRLLALPLSDFPLIHFATHAVASSQDPESCAVILSSGEKLAMRRITELDLGPALVVLSACQTGEGEVVPGEGVVGLSWAFLSAGARGVVASLWSVEDEATTALMVSFHQNLKTGADPVTALGAAQRALSLEHRHPLYWAPFTVILRPQLKVED